MAGVTALVVGGIAAAATAGSYFEQKKAAREAERAQKKANQTSQAQAQVENARARRRAIAQARIAQAQNQAQSSEALTASSSLAGVQSGISSQLGANIGAQTQRIQSQQAIQGYQQKAASALREGQERAGMWNMVGGFAQMGFPYAAQDFGKTQQ